MHCHNKRFGASVAEVFWLKDSAVVPPARTPAARRYLSFWDSIVRLGNEK